MLVRILVKIVLQMVWIALQSIKCSVKEPIFIFEEGRVANWWADNGDFDVR